ncbi:hypothetical protein ACFS27_03195 [Promicromonospora vindobonensis]|uniref:Uncharacterized protein n=1 Tax=Promicromonospora vindobonensis TaxID=195748 RepID=A0ABW5VNF2_9MICO
MRPTTTVRPFQVGDNVRAAGLFDEAMRSGPILLIHDCPAKIGHEAFCAAYVEVDKSLPETDPKRLVQVFLTADATGPLNERHRIELLGDGLTEAIDSASHRSSSQAGLASLITSGGAVTQPNPAPSDDSTHLLDRLPGEPNARDLDPVYGFTADVERYERPTVWLTREQYTALGEPQQITVTIGAVR